MATIPQLVVTPSAAAQAYAGVGAGNAGGITGQDFGAVMQRAIGGVIDANRDAEQKSMQAIAGGGNLTDVVTAVSKAELALQTTVAIRDRVVQAYQDIMKMPI